MSSQTGHERLVDANPNPLGTCFCGVSREDCPGGPGYVSPQEIEGVPGNYANFVSLACIKRMAGAESEGESLSVSENPLHAHFQGGDPMITQIPEPHVNPSADTLEEATRLLEERDDEDRWADNGGPVI